MNGGLEVSLGVHGDTEVKQEQEGSEASRAATHACKALRTSLKKVDKPLRTLVNLKRTFVARAAVYDDKDVTKWQDASKHLNTVLEGLEKFHEDCEHVCALTEHVLKEGVDKTAEDRETAVAKFETICKMRATQCDEYRKSADEHIKNATAKAAEMKFKVTTDPSEWGDDQLD